MFLSNILLTLLALNIFVLVHEAGHFWAARRAGVKVYEFSIGFGPKLFGWRRGEVDYSVRALFLGGFVRMAGVEEAIEGGHDDEKLDENDPGHFNTKPLLTRLGILFAGPFANYVLAFLLFTFSFVAFGIRVDDPGSEARIGYVVPRGPAYISGLRVGDEIVGVNGKAIATWEEMSGLIRSNPGKTLTLNVKRDGRVIKISVTPRQAQGVTRPRGEIGIQHDFTFEKVGFFEGIRLGALQTYYVHIQIAKGIYQMIAGRLRADLVGPVGLVDEFGQVARKGFGWSIFYMGIISENLGFFNLIPIPLPLLDGGWIAIFIIERIRRKPFKPKERAAAQMVGLALILALFVFVTFSDVSNMIRRYF